MPMNKAMYYKAQELGELLRDTEEYKALERAEADGQADARLSAAVAEYIQARARLEDETLREIKDFAQIGALTRELDDITERMHILPAYIAIQQAKSVFDGVMRQVSDCLAAAVRPGMTGGCGGDCAACRGCGGR